MIKELKTSQLIQMKKLSQQLYEMFDSALAYRKTLIEKQSTSEYEHAQFDSMRDPESYYHFKLFDKAVSIVRIYDKRDWFRKDDEDEFHFTICCYGFNPNFNIQSRSYSDKHFYGDFKSIESCIKYFIAACVSLTDNQFNIIDPLFKEEYVLIK